MWRTLEQFQCLGTHSHDVIAGSCRHPKFGRMPLTQYTEMYTATFGRRLGRAVKCSSQVHEQTVDYATMFSHATDLALAAEQRTEDTPVAKRRRLAGKISSRTAVCSELLESFGDSWK